MNKKGFTLIEILAVVGIIAVVSGFAITSYSSSIRARELETEALSLIKTIETARKSATSGDLGGCSSLLLYRVSIEETSYTLSAECDSGEEGLSHTTAIDPKKQLVLSSEQGEDIFFAALTGAVNTTNCITLTDTKTSRCYSINIGTGGAIESYEGACACP